MGNPSILAIVGVNQFQVYNLTNDGKYSKKTTYNLTLNG
jgi:hypothetical protein